MAAVAGTVWFALALVLFAGHGRYSVGAVADRCGAAAPDVRVAPSAEQVRAFLVDCGAAGRDAWRDLQLVDLVYPAALGVFLTALIALMADRIAPRLRGLAALPAAAAGADYLENLAVRVLLERFPESPDWATALLRVASAAKVVLTTLSWLVVVAGVAVLVARRLADTGRRRAALR